MLVVVAFLVELLALPFRFVGLIFSAVMRHHAGLRGLNHVVYLLDNDPTAKKVDLSKLYEQ